MCNKFEQPKICRYKKLIYGITLKDHLYKSAQLPEGRKKNVHNFMYFYLTMLIKKNCIYNIFKLFKVCNMTKYNKLTILF